VIERASRLSAEIVEDEASFTALKNEWDALFARASPKMPFLTFSWVRLCWRRQRSETDARLFVVVIRDGGRAVLIAPFVAHRRLLIFSTLFWLDSLTPQYCDVLVETSAHADEYIACLLRVLRRHWRVLGLRLVGLREDSYLAPHLSGARGKITKRDVCQSIDLREFAGWEDYFSSRSSNLRRDHRKQLRRLERAGSFHSGFAVGSEAVDQIAWLFRTKRVWLSQKFPSAKWFAQPGTEALLSAAAIEGLPSGRTWLGFLSVDGRTIAATMGFREGENLFLSKTTYDPEWGHYSPGRTLWLLNIARAFQEKIEKVDLMTGEGFGKERLADHVAVVVDRRIRLF
jgi:CelD/BcsL family acetyltransferase involved in cellulose biosynthesis